MEEKKPVSQKLAQDLATSSLFHEGGRVFLDGLSVKLDLVAGFPVFTAGEVLAKRAVRRVRGIEKIRYVHPQWGLIEMDVKTRRLPDGRRLVVKPLVKSACVVKPTREYEWVKKAKRRENEMLRRYHDWARQQREAQLKYLRERGQTA